MTRAHARTTALLLRPAVIAAALLLSGCMGIDVVSVRHADAATPRPAEGTGVVTGRIRHLVDGQPWTYGFLDKPHLSLLHHPRGVLMSSPETRADGSFRWQLPAGHYRVAVIFGGMSPTRQPLPLPGGTVIRVNGIVDPGASFTLAPGAVLDLGTLAVEVTTRPSSGTLFAGGPVFDRLAGLRVEDAPPLPAGAAPAGWVLRPRSAPNDASAERAPPHPAVLAPLLPLLIR